MIVEKNILRLVCLCLSFNIISTSCTDETEEKTETKPQAITLSADKSALKTRGDEVITFTVKADNKDVTNQNLVHIIYKEENTPLSGNTFFTNIPGTYTFYATYENLSSPEIQISALPLIFNLSADTTAIRANGNQAVTFTLTADDKTLSTNEAKLFCQHGDEVVPLDHFEFKTTEVGNYIFYAEYQEYTSNSISVEVTVSNLTLTSDVIQAKTGERITFTAVSDDTNDVSPEITLHIESDDYKETLTGQTFTPSTFGDYTVYATFEDRISNELKISVLPSKLTLSADKNTLLSTGADSVTFTVYADEKRIEDAVLYVAEKGKNEYTELKNLRFASNLPGTFSLYVQYKDLKSENMDVTVNFVDFRKQCCAMEAVATWCGYSPQMIAAFHQVQESYGDQIQIISLHRSNSTLGSTDINTEEYLLAYNDSEAVPFGLMDFDRILGRSADNIYKAFQNMQYTHPVKAGIAIESQKNENSIDVTLRVKVNETDTYSVCAIIVEDGVVKEQTIYENNSKENTIRDDKFVHNSVATYIMPGTNLFTGKSLGIVQPGEEVVEKFSIPLNKVVTQKRTVKHDNCRVVAYVLKNENGTLYINNATTCPIDGTIEYQYAE